MTTSGINAQTREILTKDILIAALTSPNKQVALNQNPQQAAQQIAEMYRIIYTEVSK